MVQCFHHLLIFVVFPLRKKNNAVNSVFIYFEYICTGPQAICLYLQFLPHSASQVQPQDLRYMSTVPISDSRIASYPGRFVKSLVSLLPLILTALYYNSLGPDGLAFFQSRVLSASYPYSYATCRPHFLQPHVHTALCPYGLVSLRPRILTASYPHCLAS